jgi:prepilin peptidase CpaA
MVIKLIHALAWSGTGAGLLASLWTDLKDRLIPNELVGLVGASGLTLCLLQRPGQIWLDLLVAVLLIVVLGVLARYGFMGGGDVKMIGAASLLFPAAQAGQLLVAIALAGGVLSSLYLLARFALRAGPVRDAADPGWLGDPGPEGWFRGECARIAAGGPLPYALAIAGGVAVMIAGELPTCLSANSCWL